MTVVLLPTTLVVRYRAVDRELIGAPAHVVDTPAHLDALTDDIRERGILIPLDLGFNDEFATLDGNHRIAVALRLGIPAVPVVLRELPIEPRPYWAQSMLSEDYEVLRAAFATQVA
jgi:ParB-like chromosome segregation protein Spo0J